MLKGDAIGLILPRTLDFVYKEAIQLLFMRLVVLLAYQLMPEFMYNGGYLSLSVQVKRGKCQMMFF
jgi:hypothetical protein